MDGVLTENEMFSEGQRLLFFSNSVSKLVLYDP